VTASRRSLWRTCLARGVRWLSPPAIVVAAFGLRLLRLGEANLWWDEALAVWAVRKGLVGATLWTAADVHPPLYFWSLWGWVQVVGESELAMRLLSASFGVLTVAGVYALGKLVGGWRAGVVAALLTALSRFHVWWSQEMRMYVLAGLCCTLSLYCFLRWFRAERTPSGCRASVPWLMGYLLASVAALYTVLLSGAVMVAQNLVMLAVLMVPAFRRGRLMGRWVVAQAVVALSVAGWLALSWGRMRSWSVTEPMAPGLFARLYAVLLTTGISTDIDRMVPFAVLPMVVLVVGGVVLARGWRRRREGDGGPLEAATLLLGWTLPAAVVYAATLPRSLFYTPRVEARYLLPFAPAFWTLLGWAVATLIHRWRAAGYACLAALVALWAAVLPGHYAGRHLRDELQTMVRTILSQAEPGDVVLLDSGSRYPIFDYYYRREPAGCAGRPTVHDVPPDDRQMTPEAVAALLPDQVAGAPRVWLAEVDVHLTDPERLARSWLDDRYTQVRARSYGHNTLLLYDAQGRPPKLDARYTPQYVVDARAGTGGHLLGWELPVRGFAPGDTMHLSLLWASLPREPVTVTLRDNTGHVVGRCGADSAGVREAVRQQCDLHVSLAIPTGEYTLELSPAPERGAVLGTVRIVNSTRPASDEPGVRLSARWERGIVLQGYTLHVPQHVRPGSELLLDLYWRPDAPVYDDLVVFTHLLGDAYNPSTEGPVWGQHDGRPGEGAYPSALWRAEEVALDRHIMLVSADAPEGIYRLEVGLYRAADGVRLMLAEGGAVTDHLVLPDEVRVRR